MIMYSPNIEGNRQKKIKFYNDLGDIEEKLLTKDVNISVGDANAMPR